MQKFHIHNEANIFNSVYARFKDSVVPPVVVHLHGREVNATFRRQPMRFCFDKKRLTKLVKKRETFCNLAS